MYIMYNVIFYQFKRLLIGLICFYQLQIGGRCIKRQFRVLIGVLCLMVVLMFVGVFTFGYYVHAHFTHNIIKVNAYVYDMSMNIHKQLKIFIMMFLKSVFAYIPILTYRLGTWIMWMERDIACLKIFRWIKEAK